MICYRFELLGERGEHLRQTRSQSLLICSSKATKDWGEMMSRSRGGLPLMQRVLVKTASGATGNESALKVRLGRGVPPKVSNSDPA